MAFTVTATQSGSSSQGGNYLLVQVLTGATEAGGASSGGNNLSGGIAQGTLTPNSSNSLVIWSITADGLAAVFPAAASGNTYYSNQWNNLDNWDWAGGYYSGTVTSGTALTYGCGTNPGSDHENWCAYEVQPSGGTTPAVDASSPALAASTAHGLSITTASFTPPAGSVLVAMVGAGGTGAGTGITVTMSDTSGSGMTWTQRAISSSSDNFQPAYIFTATFPGAAGPAGPPPSRTRPGKTWRHQFRHRQALPLQPPPNITANAGLATGTGTAQQPAIKPYITTITGSGTAAYFTDNTGAPRILWMEMAWGLPGNAGRWNGSGGGTYQQDFDTYFSTRASQGFTGWWGTPWVNHIIDPGAPFTDGRTWDGVYPLTVNGTAGTIATGTETIALNNSFWTRIDYMISSALANGITIFLNLGMAYDYANTGYIWRNLSSTQANTFGQLIAARYPQATYPNLAWAFGDDCDQFTSGVNVSWDTGASQMLAGIQAAGDTRTLIGCEQVTGTNSQIEFDTGAVFDSGGFGVTSATWNQVYTYVQNYVGIEDSYTQSHTPKLAVMWGDGKWYGDSTSGAVDYTIRRAIWWALSSGARGVNNTEGPSGNTAGLLWTWQSSATSWLTSSPNGSFVTSTAKKIRDFFTGLPGWHTLAPDTSSVLVTAGRGTRGTAETPGNGTANYGDTDNYVTASRTPDSGSGSALAVIYCGQHFSVTIDQTKMVSGYSATWVDPSTLATTGTTTGTTYNSTGLGNNSAGNPDWVLILGPAPAGTTASAGLAAGTGTAQQPAPAITPKAALAAGAGTAQQPLPAATAPAGLAAGTGTAQQPAAAITPAVQLPAGAGTAQPPVPAITAPAGLATGTGTALQPAVQTSGSTTANAQLATGTGAAQPPAAAIATPAGAAAGIGAAQPPGPQVTASAGLAPGTGAALQPSISASGNTTASAQLAAGTGTAQPPVPAITVPAGLATAAGAAQAGQRTIPAGLATAAATARTPALAILAQTQAATALAAALSPAAQGITPPVYGTATATSSTTAAATATSSGTASATPGGAP